jgi:hypothetical protein
LLLNPSLLARTTLIRRAGNWFLQSGIQEASGGVARYYRSDLSQYAPVSTEITGYAVSFLLFLHQRTGSGDYLDSALRGARFLTRTAWDSTLGVFPFEHSMNGSGPTYLSYFFDTGIIVRALLGAWRVTREVEFLDTAVAAGRGMLAYFQATKAIHPILTLPDRRSRPYEPKWSASPGCYQLKSALAWYELHEETGDETFLAAYQSSVERALADEPSFLPGNADPEKVMDRLHAFAYFLEGLLPCSGRSDCAVAFRNGIIRVAALLREIAPRFERSDVYAQLLRARLFGSELGIAPLDREAAAFEAEKAAGFQLSSEDPKIDGAFAFGRKQSVLLPYVNPVSTAFCVQTLMFWDDYQEGTFKPDRLTLV